MTAPSIVSTSGGNPLPGKMSRVIAVTILAATLTFAAAAQPKTQPAEPLSVAISEAQVTVTNATPGGKVVFFGMARFAKNHRVTVRRFDKAVTDDDGDGKVVLEIGETLPWKTIFAAVDFTSGRYGLTTTGDFPLMTIPFEKEIMVPNNGQLNRLIIERRYLDLVLVRPGVGVWGQILGDGNKFDEDGTGDGKVVGNVERSISIGDKVPAPKKFDKGDIVLLIDSQRMQSYAVEVGSK
jgi:hypothetical protein